MRHAMSRIGLGGTSRRPGELDRREDQDDADQLLVQGARYRQRPAEEGEWDRAHQKGCERPPVDVAALPEAEGDEARDDDVEGEGGWACDVGRYPEQPHGRQVCRGPSMADGRVEQGRPEEQGREEEGIDHSRQGRRSRLPWPVGCRRTGPASRCESGRSMEGRAVIGEVRAFTLTTNALALAS